MRPMNSSQALITTARLYIPAGTMWTAKPRLPIICGNAIPMNRSQGLPRKLSQTDWQKSGDRTKDNHERPMSEFHIRAIPPPSKRYVATTHSTHHGQHYGSLIMIDLNIPDDGMGSQITKPTPQVGYPEVDVDNKIWSAQSGHRKFPRSAASSLASSSSSSASPIVGRSSRR